MTIDLTGNELLLAIVVAVGVLILLDGAIAGGGMMAGAVHAACTPWGAVLMAALVVAVLIAVLS